MLTIFTPAYNRSEKLQRLYRTLQNQTLKNFEWIVVDDGSSDDTYSLLSQWAVEETDFPVIAVRTSNGGKHRALNIGVRLARGESFFVVDSDDELIETAVADISRWFSTISGDAGIAGVSGLKGRSESNPIGGWGTFTEEYVDAAMMDRSELGLMGDKAEVYKTDVMRQFPLPEFDGENFLTEVYHTEIAAAGYKLRWFKKVIYLCDYYNDGLTARGFSKFLENPRGLGYLLNAKEHCYGTAATDKERFRDWLLLIKRYPLKDAESYILNSDSSTTVRFTEWRKALINGLNDFFRSHSVKRIAIYGLGRLGEILLTLQDELSADIAFGMDKQAKRIPGLKTICPGDAIPTGENVDLILVTIKNRDEQLNTELCRIFRNVHFWCDISKDNWLW